MTKKIETNYRVGENKVSFSQTSKGFWYCSDLTINCYSVVDGIALMEHAISKVEVVLEKINTKHDMEIGDGGKKDSPSTPPPTKKTR